METKEVHLAAFHLAAELQLREIRAHYTGELIGGNLSELFYRAGEQRYLYLFPYGAVVFANFSEAEMSKTLQFLQPYTDQPLEEKISERYRIVQAELQQPHFQFEQLQVPQISEDVTRTVMFALAQSVALSFYNDTSERMLAEVKQIALQLKQDGRIRISKKDMLRFFGKSLLTKNAIVENLYIFEAPSLVWEDEYLKKLNDGLGQFFELRTRFVELEYKLRYIDDNLEVFREILQHNESSRLEWIIIILILIEIVDLFVSKVMG